MKTSLGFNRFSGLYMLVVFVVIFSILAPDSFPTTATLHILASTQAVSAIVALALLIPFVAGQFDVSVGATAILAGVCAALLQTKGWMSPASAIGTCLLIGAVIGFVNGFIVVKLRVNSFIATLGMGSVLAAVVLIVTGNQEVVRPLDSYFYYITQTTIFGFQAIIVYLFVIALVLWWVLERTPAGRYLRATGGNPEAARLTGIRVDLWAWVSLVVSGVVAAIAGILFVSLSGPSVTFGESLLLPGFAAVFLGSTQLTPGRMNVWGTIIAIFVLAVGVQGLQLVTGVTWVAPMFNGVALVLAVALAVGRERRVAKGQDTRESEDAHGDDYGDIERMGSNQLSATSPDAPPPRAT